MARILSYNQEVGTYNLNCKPGVSVSSIRWRDPEKESRRKQEEAEKQEALAEKEALELKLQEAMAPLSKPSGLHPPPPTKPLSG